LEAYLRAISNRHDSGVRLAIWKATKDGKPANGGSGSARAIGQKERVTGPLTLCGPGALHATLNPGTWEGERCFVVALTEPVIDEGDKLGSLEREIIMEIPNYWA
jgi:hypothetical protein